MLKHETAVGPDHLTWRIARKRDDVFAGNTGNAHGDKDGSDATHTLFTVTGDVLIHSVAGVVNTTLTEDAVPGGAKLEVGVVGNTAKLIAQSTALDLNDGDIWTDAGAEVGIDLIPNTMFIINDGLDIIETVSTSDIDSGQIDYYCIWAALENGAFIVGA